GESQGPRARGTAVVGVAENPESVSLANDAARGIEGLRGEDAVDSHGAAASQCIVDEGNCVVREWPFETGQLPGTRKWRGGNWIVDVVCGSDTVRHGGDSFIVGVVNVSDARGWHRRVGVTNCLQGVVEIISVKLNLPLFVGELAEPAGHILI